MNILVTGSNGQLGSEIKDVALSYKSFRFFFMDLPALDICNSSQLDIFIAKNKIDTVINCAAFTAVDAAEENAVSTMLQERGLDRNDVWIGLNYDYTSSPNAWKWINGFDYDTYSNWVDYDTSVDGSGFLENPVAKWWSDGWRNRGVSDGGRILIEFDNNVTAASNLSLIHI